MPCTPQHTRAYHALRIQHAKPRSSTHHLRAIPHQAPAPITDGKLLRVFLVSDVHTDYAANAAWAARLHTRHQRNGQGYVCERRFCSAGCTCHNSINVLLLPGDVSDDPTILATTLRHCLAAFDHVVFVPGNHCLWVRSTSQSNGVHHVP